VNANLDNIRLATWADLELMLAWRGSTTTMRDAITQEFLNLQLGTCQIFLAFGKENELIATVQIQREHPDPDFCDEISAYVEALDVRHEFRRRGIASTIMDFLEQHAKQQGIERLTLMVETDNAPAVALYQKLGFHGSKNSFWVWDGKEIPTICLEKHLTKNISNF
jgi:ribosomal protein S18 acetylase RimI-like enzyme